MVIDSSVDDLVLNGTGKLPKSEWERWAMGKIDKRNQEVGNDDLR